MHPILEFGKISIPTYGVMAVVGFLIALLVMLHIANWYHIRKEDIVYASIYCIGGITVGAKFVYFLTTLPNVIQNIDVFLDHPIEGLGYMFGGWVFYGGLIGAAAAVYIYCRRYHLDVWPFADCIAPVIPFFHAFGRIGCHFAGCCYGKEYHGHFSVTFPYSVFTAEMAGVPRVPVQLMEATFDFLLFLFLYFYVKKKPKPGRALGIYAIVYAIIRFILEFLRADSYRGGFLSLSTSQWISILMIPVGLWLILKDHKVKELSTDK